MISNVSLSLMQSIESCLLQIDCFTNDSWAIKRVSSQRRVFVLPVTRVRTAVFIKPSKMFAWLDVKAPLGSAAASPAFSLSLSFLPRPLLLLFAHFRYVRTTRIWELHDILSAQGKKHAVFSRCWTRLESGWKKKEFIWQYFYPKYLIGR